MTSTTKKHQTYYQSLDILRLVLAFFVCIKALGFPTGFGSYIQAFSTFAVPAFYIISGFLELQEREDFEPHLCKVILRTGTVFAALAAFYVLCSVLSQLMMNAPLLNGVQPFFSKRAIFNFIVYQDWPLFIGGNLWFLHGMLYAYIIIYLLHHFHLMKLEMVLLPLLLVLSYACGEFAGLLNIQPFGMTYLSSNFLNCALPYLLLGRLLHSKKGLLLKTRVFVFPVMTIGGLVIFALEVFLLGNAGKLVTASQFIGTTVTAVSLCCLCFCVPATRFFTGEQHPGNRIAKTAYWLHNPIGSVLRPALLRSSFLTFAELSGYMSMLVFGIIMIGAFFWENIPGIVKFFKKLKYVQIDSPAPVKKRTPLKRRLRRMMRWLQFQQEMAQRDKESRHHRHEQMRSMRKYEREEAARHRRHQIRRFLRRFRRD